LLRRLGRLRSELDAFFAWNYSLTCDELSYILDPADANHPSETFRALKSNEEARYHEYRTRRLVLGAWDRFAVTNVDTDPIAGARSTRAVLSEDV